MGYKNKECSNTSVNVHQGLLITFLNTPRPGEKLESIINYVTQ